jgi:hypothetical protein
MSKLLLEVSPTCGGAERNAMPHDLQHDCDFRLYVTTRQRVIRRIKKLRAYLPQLEALIVAMPATSGDAGYLDLDNVQQWDSDLSAAAALLVDWNAVHAAAKRGGGEVK